ncbi:glycoside hydrolase family 5 protein [Bacillus sp. HMF5848]|uniref:glycoside hydrolase family 5 protein n=1 Tax=Bacillus sp. HMF5848 TaxID=2495421 RepID=UPI000F7B87EC|nr:glycoside hydrolase family 5 protein [Bacillus sp. HMF5848]RSK25450.1 glycoside hydrolase family 5 protein [Bacillus sp. HMF5848]
MSRKLKKFSLVMFGSVLGLVIALMLLIYVSPNGKITFPIKHKPVFSSENIEQYPTALKTINNRIVDEDGQPFQMKGLMAQDPAVLKNRNLFSKKLYEDIRETGANTIRVPVHPDRWVDDEDYLWRYLDKIVAWAGELGMYVIIDWHYIGNIQSGVGAQLPDIDEHPLDLTIQFWEQVAPYFKDVPHVIFEIYNEPADINEQTWQKHANDIVQIVRKAGADQLIIVGGIDYSFDITWALDNPIDSKNIAYTSHVYPSRSRLLWDVYIREVAETYPVLVTEWGFMNVSRNETKQTYLIGSTEEFGAPFLDFMNEHNIGWVACWYDDTWEPPMFEKNFKATNEFGEFILSTLKE